MSFTEFCCRSGGSNMNGGALSTNGEPATSAVYSATNGGWNSGTGVFTPTSGDPSASVTVGDWANVFTDGSTTPVFIGRVTAVNSTTVTVSTTAKGGTAPTTAGTGISINVGGAWAGPNGTVGFPFNFATGAMVNAAGDTCRVNFKNGSNYAITAAMTHTLIGPVQFQGYTTTFGDLGKAVVDGGTSGASYVLLTLSSNGVDRTVVSDLIFQNNGATGSASGIDLANDNRTTGIRLVVNSVRGAGFVNATFLTECEAYACNQSNTANIAGFNLSGGCFLRRCISHDNTGSNASGFYTQANGVNLLHCIADTNGGSGFVCNNINGYRLIGCDSYNNTGDGLAHLTASVMMYIENCNFVANGGYGINTVTGTRGFLFNNGFGDNATAAKNNTGNMTEVGTVTYGGGVRPWVDAPNGDFRITLTDSKGTGRANFTQTAASYAGTVGYPDIGAAQHQDAGGTTVVGVIGG